MGRQSHLLGQHQLLLPKRTPMAAMAVGLLCLPSQVLVVVDTCGHGAVPMDATKNQSEYEASRV